MCMGGRPSAPAAPKVDPAPTPVQPTDVQAGEGSGAAERREAERRKRGRAGTFLRNDEDTILGAAKGRDSLG